MEGQPSTQIMMGPNLEAITAKLLTQWDWRNDEAFAHEQGTVHSASSSPNSSLDSMCSSPEMPGNTNACQPYASLPYSLAEHSPTRRTSHKGSKSKMSTKRRIKASEREKMRMRSLAEALHHLRDFLPPDYNRRGQPLTKIQTLKYTIEYIKELSDILNHS
ncbi:mesogenin-1 [Engraulis encrasicolus]|uniref:mesogenin-1 n=1 Tax=Engraulis encrasicolus TaxID=184585 RepID=UPI002FCF66E8